MPREEERHYGPPRGNRDERWKDGSSSQQPRNNRNRDDSFDGRMKNDDDARRHRHRDDSFGERDDNINMDRRHPPRGGGDGGQQQHRPLSHSQQQQQSQQRQSTRSSDAPSHLPVQHRYQINPHAKLDSKLATLSEPTPQNEDPRGDDPMKRITNKAQKRGNGMNTESFDPASTLVRPDLRVWVGSKDTKEFDKTLKHDDGMLLILISFVKYVAFRVRSI